MTLPSSRTVAYAVMGGSAAFNIGVLIGDIHYREYASAAAQMFGVAIPAVFFWLAPKADAWLDARRAEAEANARAAAIAAAEMTRLARLGQLQVGVQLQGTVVPTERMH